MCSAARHNKGVKFERAAAAYLFKFTFHRYCLGQQLQRRHANIWHLHSSGYTTSNCWPSHDEIVNMSYWASQLLSETKSENCCRVSNTKNMFLLIIV